MNTSKLFFRGLVALLAIVLMAGVALGQGNLVIQAGSSFTGSGTYNVKGNIDNAEAKSIGGTVNLTGGAQSVGTTGALTFETLVSQTAGTKTQNVGVTVNTALTLTDGSFDVNGNTLNIDGTGSRTTGTLAAGGPTSTVNYRNGGASQTVIDATYTNLGLSAASTKSLQGAVTAGTVTHTGGTLTVDQDLTVNTSGTFAEIANIDAGKTLALGSGASSITTLTAVNATGNLVNGAGALTVTNLADNAGTITAATNGGAMTFTNAATNAGNITGGTGPMTFSSTLGHSIGTITAGGGGATFNGVATIASGTVTAGTGATLDFNADVSNAGTISLTGTGEATFAGSFTAQTGTVNLANGSLWTYDGTNQDVAGGGVSVTYGRLTMAGSGIKTALGDITVDGNFTNSSGITTNMRTYALTLNADRFNTGATMQFAGLNNGRIFDTGTVEYNGTTTDAATQTIALGAYENLLFSNNAPKNIAAGTVSTSAALNVSSGVTANVASDGILTVGTNLTNAGTLSNAGVVNVGN